MMKIIEQELGYRVSKPTVFVDSSLGLEYHRSATWQDGDVTTKVTAIAFVSAIRARRNADGSIDLLGLMAKNDVLGKGEFVQPVERAFFLWERETPDGREEAADIANEIGVVYADTLEKAEAMCRQYIENLDFERHFDPEAW